MFKDNKNKGNDLYGDRRPWYEEMAICVWACGTNKGAARPIVEPGTHGKADY